MKNKIISGVVGAIIGGIIVFGYSSFFTETQNNNSGTTGMGSGRNGGPGEDTRNMREKSNIRSKTNSGSTMTGKILDEKPNNLE